MQKFLRTAATIVAGLAFASGAHAASSFTIDFDTNAQGQALVAAPLFVDTTPLTNAYASLGVTFSGLSGIYPGGSILNQAGNFGVPAHSGVNFLAFNTYLGSAPEKISFDNEIQSLSLYVAAGETFTLSTFNAQDQLLNSSTLFTWDWAQLSVAAQGIKYVTLSVSGGDNVFVVDDLTVQGAVPEPEQFALVLAGLLTVGTLARRQARG
ncbi:MAG: hypothetical protein EOP38_15540 [Rubrivivax sp.]|nr:MAG: hypothetical protein EOP38_15540 [Rubrivivax sp.]